MKHHQLVCFRIFRVFVSKKNRHCECGGFKNIVKTLRMKATTHHSYISIGIQFGKKANTIDDEYLRAHWKRLSCIQLRIKHCIRKQVFQDFRTGQIMRCNNDLRLRFVVGQQKCNLFLSFPARTEYHQLMSILKTLYKRHMIISFPDLLYPVEAGIASYRRLVQPQGFCKSIGGWCLMKEPGHIVANLVHKPTAVGLEKHLPLVKKR